MVYDAVVVNHDIAATLEELIHQGSHRLWPPLMDQGGKASQVCEEHRDLRKAAGPPVDVSDVTDVGVFVTSVDPKGTPDPSPKPGEVHLPIDEQPRKCHNLPRRNLVMHALDLCEVVDETVVGEMDALGHRDLPSYRDLPNTDPDYWDQARASTDLGFHISTALEA